MFILFAFGQGMHDLGNSCPELFLYRSLGVLLIFDDVVKQTGHCYICGESMTKQDDGHMHGVGNVWYSGGLDRL